MHKYECKDANAEGKQAGWQAGTGSLAWLGLLTETPAREARRRKFRVLPLQTQWFPLKIKGKQPPGARGAQAKFWSVSLVNTVFLSESKETAFAYLHFLYLSLNGRKFITVPWPWPFYTPLFFKLPFSETLDGQRSHLNVFLHEQMQCAYQSYLSSMRR